MWSSIREFYNSTEWKKCRQAYRKRKEGLCERCLKNGLIVPADEIHHKIRLTKDNINDPKISLNFDNLEALCEACHDKEHEQDIQNRQGDKRKASQKKRRYAVDKRTGKIICH